MYTYAMNKRCFTGLLLLISMILSLSTYAVDSVNSTLLGNVAIKGYDTVAYFSENRAVKGRRKFQFKWNNAKWYFSTPENLALFKQTPKKFAPQYGGYCAYAVAHNHTAPIEPTQFTIYNDKLYLNYNKKINNQWLLDKDTYIKNANIYWPLLQD